MIREVRWTDWDGDGLEHCILNLSPDGLTLNGVVAGTRETHYGARYFVGTDDVFRTREVRVEYLGGPSLNVSSNGEGQWTDIAENKPIPELDGCFDVDIGVTPSTNALPVKRLNLALNESRDICAAYVPLPSQISGNFIPRRADQRYTCLDQGRCYLYEGIFRKFSAELLLDEAGLVIDYPDTFKRIWSR